MIKFLVTAAIVLVCLFILVLVSCLMVWVVMRLLRWLFPQRFGGKAASVKKRNTDRSQLPDVRSGKCVTKENPPPTARD